MTLYDNDVTIFNDTMSALGLTQHVTQSTHHLNNTLELMFSELDNSIKMGKVNLGAVLSDHRMVYSTLSIKKPLIRRDEVQICKISVITEEDLCNEYNADMPFDNGDLDTLISKLNTELERTVDALALVKKVSLTTHKRQPWYEDDIK